MQMRALTELLNLAGRGSQDARVAARVRMDRLRRLPCARGAINGSQPGSERLYAAVMSNFRLFIRHRLR
jgi:hypothetical protein